LAIFVASLAALYVFKAKTTIVWVVLIAAVAGLVLFK
jgi:chromate transporter